MGSFGSLFPEEEMGAQGGKTRGHRATKQQRQDSDRDPLRPPPLCPLPWGVATGVQGFLGEDREALLWGAEFNRRPKHSDIQIHNILMQYSKKKTVKNKVKKKNS